MAPFNDPEFGPWFLSRLFGLVVFFAIVAVIAAAITGQL